MANDAEAADRYVSLTGEDKPMDVGSQGLQVFYHHDSHVPGFHMDDVALEFQSRLKLF